jgi:cell division septum initiation protein DivIVA
MTPVGGTFHQLNQENEQLRAELEQLRQTVAGLAAAEEKNK